jgi:hypothetical protein
LGDFEQLSEVIKGARIIFENIFSINDITWQYYKKREKTKLQIMAHLPPF